MPIIFKLRKNARDGYGSKFSGQVVFGKAFDLLERKEVPVPEGIQRHLSPQGLLLHLRDKEGSLTGLLLLPEGPMLISSQPILTSERQGPNRGALIWGRYLNAAEVKGVAQRTHLSLTTSLWEDGQAPPDFQAIQPALLSGEPVVVQPLSQQSVAGYALLKDIYGQPALVLRATMPRDIHLQGQATLRYFMVDIVAVGIAFGAVTLLLLDRSVLDRLSRLSASLRAIGARGQPTTRVQMPGGDELSSLAAEINLMLEALERQALELQHSNAELEQFAYVASHDLQEPLRMVISYTQMLQRRYAGRLDADADQFIAFAVDGATRMQQLINDILAYSQVGTRSKEVESTDCEKVLSTALANLQAAIAESGAVVTHSPLPTVMADGMHLGQVFQNLIGNAIKYHSEKRPEVDVGAERRNGEWLFSVRDNGIGIDPSYRERVFGVFERLHTRDEYPGTGIGLAICKRIVERQGGRIWVESQPGMGATFFFTLPAAKGSKT